jgi:hypothetical protein
MESLAGWMKNDSPFIPTGSKMPQAERMSRVALVAGGNCAATCEALDIHGAAARFALE